MLGTAIFGNDPDEMTGKIESLPDDLSSIRWIW